MRTFSITPFEELTQLGILFHHMSVGIDNRVIHVHDRAPSKLTGETNWSAGVMERWVIITRFIRGFLPHSNTPVLHHSISQERHAAIDINCLTGDEITQR